jgi:hypothetical protein
MTTAAGYELHQTLRGLLSLTVSGTDSRYYPAEWVGYIDGELLTIAWTDNSGKPSQTVTMLLDTTRFTNGRHELYAVMHSDYWPACQIVTKPFYSARRFGARGQDR